MTYRFIPLNILLIYSLATSAQTSGQIPTNLSGGGAAQGVTAGAIASLLGPVSDANSKRNINWEEFQGSPYVSDVFKPTQLFYKDENMGNIFYRYNALNEEVEIKESLTQQGVRGLSRDKNIRIFRDGRPMSFHTFIDRKGNTLNGYLTHLYDGETYDLYKRTHVKYTEGSKAANSFVKATPSRFTHFEEFYLQKKGVDRIDEFLPKKSGLYQLEPEKKETLKVFFKEHKPDLDSEADLIKVLEYLDGQS
jgi:hypothetical protein